MSGCNAVIGLDGYDFDGTAGYWAGTGGAAGSAGDAGKGGTAGTGGSTGVGGSAAADASAEGGSGGECAGTQPAAMVTLPGGYSIDSTEVTRCQYEVWLSTNPSPVAQPAECAMNEFEPSCAWPPSGMGAHPVVCVDWCDAYAYCKGVGKRLCGKIGAGANPHSAYADSTSSQWFAACSSSGQYDYPYGDTYDAQICNVGETGIGTSVPVGTLSDCQSPAPGYAGVFDMSGNVWEWEDSCEETDAGPTNRCRARGGSFFANNTALYVTCDRDNSYDRKQHYDRLGFRCCSP